ncbi:MAG TPA: rhodanese-like domain-containing protein [Candidatus Binatia bacterium]|nr:rhodanese-like domain-containing protein [Candidatus Binatia bacterium]
MGRSWRRPWTRWPVLVLLAGVLLATPAAAAGRPSLIDPSHLREALGSGRPPIVLDARSEREYAGGHIPGAISAPWTAFADFRTRRPGEPGFGGPLPPDRLPLAVGRLGIDGARPVVVYAASPASAGADGRVAWALLVAGQRDVRILDGGIGAWTGAGGALTRDIVTPVPAAFSPARPEPALDVSTAALRGRLGRVKIVDGREPDEYAGSRKSGEARGGHVPGAINLAWSQSLTPDGRVKSSAELRALFEKAGLKPDDEIVTYCTVGVRSAHLAFVLRLAGYGNAKNYPASFNEWAADPALPVETGR